jgi:ATP-dependent RNA helicase RhlE
MLFQKLGLNPELLRGIKELGFQRPTPIQNDAIPPALEGKDLLACAMTGSGQTAAFLLPVMQRLMTKKRGVTRALVITPTRELAAQIAEHFDQLAVHTPLTGAAVFGGVGMGPQEHALRSGVDVIVATPGRLLDHMRAPYARFNALEVLVLDEADRMLDMGFLPDIRRIVQRLPARRQTLFFSATMPPPIAKLASEMLHHPVRINIERQAAPAVGITQAVYPVPQNLKSKLLVELLRGTGVKSVLVFTRTKHRANRLARFLEDQRVRCTIIHGNRSQSQRTKALEGFKSGRFQVLVATDIAARGIDVEDLSHVINFDVPHVPEDYIHRVGRTARAEATGDAFTFVAPDEEEDLRQIERAIGKQLLRVTHPGFDYAARVAKETDRGPRRSGSTSWRSHGQRGDRAPRTAQPLRPIGPIHTRPGATHTRDGATHTRPAATNSHSGGMHARTGPVNAHGPRDGAGRGSGGPRRDAHGPARSGGGFPRGGPRGSRRRR